jgi:dinuclear metal center YbgI/SA1388 family protein
MGSTRRIVEYCHKYLKSYDIDDYCPNGLQVEGKKTTSRIISAVSICLPVIKEAIACKADMILTHHGFFFKNENPAIIGNKKERIRLLLSYDINLVSFHLPLDIHPKIGNNASLSKMFGLTQVNHQHNGLFYYGTLSKPQKINDFKKDIERKLNTKTQMVTDENKIVKTVGLCSGAGENFMLDAINLKLDVFVTGENNLNSFHLSDESDTAFISVGHHNSEKQGVQNLAKVLQKKYGIYHKFVDVKNIF